MNLRILGIVHHGFWVISGNKLVSYFVYRKPKTQFGASSDKIFKETHNGLSTLWYLLFHINKRRRERDIAIFNLINRNPINYKSVGIELNTSSRKLVAANLVQRIKQRLQHAAAPVSDWLSLTRDMKHETWQPVTGVFQEHVITLKYSVSPHFNHNGLGRQQCDICSSIWGFIVFLAHTLLDVINKDALKTTLQLRRSTCMLACFVHRSRS